jgi:hypothetical protein
MIVQKRERKHIPKIQIDDTKIDRTDRWRVAKCDEVWVRNSAGDAVRKHLAQYQLAVLKTEPPLK